MVIAGLALGSTIALASEPLQPVEVVELGEIKAREDVSSIAKVGDFLVIGADEGVGPKKNENIIQILREVEDDRYEVLHDILLFKGKKEDGKEMDIEGLAVEGDTVFVVGSHSAVRSRVKDDKSNKKNRNTFRDKKIEQPETRDWLYRLVLDAQGQELEKYKISLRDLIDDDAVLKTFSAIPSKENGIDIEGIAVRDGWLYLGFRGPMFRANYVPIMRLRFDDPEETYELSYVNLAGLGVRSIASVSDGFLIVAGPVGDGPGAYQLFHWDGKDMVPGADLDPAEVGRVNLLGEIEPPGDGKAEGVVILEESAQAYDLIVVFDGIEKPLAQRFQVAKD